MNEKQLKEIENYIKHDLHKAKYIEDTMFTATEGKELLNEIYRLKEELKIERAMATSLVLLCSRSPHGELLETLLNDFFKR